MERRVEEGARVNSTLPIYKADVNVKKRIAGLWLSEATGEISLACVLGAEAARVIGEGVRERVLERGQMNENVGR